MSELKNCPFCGGEACMTEHVFTGYLSTFGVVCLDCCAETRQFYDTKEEAIAAWNRRTQPENEALTLEELRQMDGEPVWIVQGNEANPEETESMWAEPYKEERGYIWFWLFGNEVEDGLLTEHYGKTWLAYRTKPERSEGE